MIKILNKWFNEYSYNTSIRTTYRCSVCIFFIELIDSYEKMN